MDPILELIARLLDEQSRAEELETLDDEQLVALRGQLVSHARAVRSGEIEGADPNDVELLTQLHDAVQVVRGEENARAEAAAVAAAEAAERAAEAERIAAEIEGEPGEDAAADEVEAEEEAAETADSTDEPEVEEVAPEPEVAHATATPARRRPPMAALINGRPEAASPRPRPNEMVARPRWQLTDGTPADAQDLMAIAERMVAARESLLETPAGFSDKVTVAQIKVPWPEERKILKSDSALVAEAKLEAVTAAARDEEYYNSEEAQAIVASGGWCAPVEPRYDIPSVSSGARPFRDSLPRIGADRGGVTYVRAARLSSIVTGGPATSGAAISLWTSGTDSSPGGSVKRRQTIACRSAVTETLDAAVARLRFGNLQSRAFPEDVRHNIELAMAAHARVAERNLLDSLIADVNVDVAQTGFFGTSRDLKNHLMQAAAQIRSVERLGDSPRIRAALPREALDMAVHDVVAQTASGETQAIEYTKANAQALLAGTGLGLTYVWETPSGADAFVTNSDGENLADYPDNMEIPIWIDGTVAYLDGGTLDLGIVRDSTLNDTNDYEIFVETFEGLAWMGPFALTLTLTTCPNGFSQIPSSITTICSGS